jgi:predicted DNA-binding transcriptional regulator AlpA
MNLVTDGKNTMQPRLSHAVVLAGRLGEVTHTGVPVWLDIQDLIDLTGLSESSIRRMERGGEFPRLHRIGPRRRGLTLQAYLDWSRACETPEGA